MAATGPELRLARLGEDHPTRLGSRSCIRGGLRRSRQHIVCGNGTDRRYSNGCICVELRHAAEQLESGNGLVRDKAKDASGEFDAIQATGSLAAATAIAEQIGVVSRSDAIEIVNRIGRALLVDAPRYHGLLPHFVRVSEAGDITIVPGTEWSSIDTTIAAVGLLAAQGSLGLSSTGTEDLLRAVAWADLSEPNGMISMGTRTPAIGSLALGHLRR